MLTEKLLHAAKTGEIVRVRYFGGSVPGSVRQLRPVSIADGKVRALSMQSEETKTFVIEKMEEVVDGVASALASSVPVATATFQSVEVFASHHKAFFEFKGWVMQSEGQAFSLHRTFKNGKLIQTPDVGLAFEAETYDAVFDGEQIIEANRRQRSRPWIVRGKNKTTKTFADIEKAQLTAYEWAIELSPTSGAV